MNTNELKAGLIEPLKKLINHIRPNEANIVGWLGFAKSGKVILSAEYNPRIGYVVLITNEPELAIKVCVGFDYKIIDDPVTYGDIESVYSMVISSINNLEPK